MEDVIKAGKITAEALALGKGMVKVGKPLLDVAEAIEEKIIELGGRPAFPVNISINHIAAHYTPTKDDPTLFTKGDLVKLDCGAHVNGYIGDSAVTIDLGDNKKLTEASAEALKEALKMFTPGTKIGEIGKKVQETITSYGYTPIVNLSGHQVEQYLLHAGQTIPNFDNSDPTELEEGQVFAVEPFATTGGGKIAEGKASGIYSLVSTKPIRDMNARKVLKFIEEEYQELPFATRWVQKIFPIGVLALRRLEQNGNIKEYAQLPETSQGIVSQAEHTVIVADKPIITTKKE